MLATLVRVAEIDGTIFASEMFVDGALTRENYTGAVAAQH